MAPRLNYDAISHVQFTEADIADVIAAAETSGFHEGKVLVSLNLSNFTFETADPAVLSEFAKLAAVMKRPVSKSYSGLEVKRELTAYEKRDAALDALRYGYGNTAKRIRSERSDEQGIDIWQPEEEPTS